MGKTPKRNTLRIIGGEWRSRKLAFPDIPQLRPTPDRVRETLFNWLQNDVHSSRCLDLFAGSGALGLEALSRGAKHCTFVETDNTNIKQLNDNLSLLKCEKATVVPGDGISYLKKANTPFDLVFLDPPFDANLWQNCLDLLRLGSLLTPNAKVYLESASKQALELDAYWKVLKEKKAGDVRYQLIELT